MKRRHNVPWLWLIGAAALVAGCSKQDTEGLGRVGRKTAARCEVVTAGVQQTVQRGCAGIWSAWESAALETRVSARLRWEKSLSEVAVEVRATGKTVELRGRVRDEQQKQRAAEVAAATLGVEKVENLLTVAKE